MTKEKVNLIKEILKDYNLLLWYKQDHSSYPIPHKTIIFSNFRWHVFSRDYKKVRRLISLILNSPD